jgi:hypothetical protein
MFGVLVSLFPFELDPRLHTPGNRRWFDALCCAFCESFCFQVVIDGRRNGGRGERERECGVGVFDKRVVGGRIERIGQEDEWTV